MSEEKEIIEQDEYTAPALIDHEMSESIGKISLALSKAQGMMSGVEKNKENPFLKSKYADLSAVIDAGREALSTNELALIQTTGNDEKHVIVKTMLSHSSGEWIKSTLKVPLVKFDAQSMGSAITYGRRYAQAAMINIAQADDDGEDATAKTQTNKTNKVSPTDDQKDAFHGFINDKDSLGLFLFSLRVGNEIYNSLFSSYKKTFDKNTKIKRSKEFNLFRQEGSDVFDEITLALSEGDAAKLAENIDDMPPITEKLLLSQLSEQQHNEYKILKSEIEE